MAGKGNHPWDCLNCAHVIALMSSHLQHRKGGNMLPYFVPPWHCTSLHCDWTNPHVIQRWQPPPVAAEFRAMKNQLSDWHLCARWGEKKLVSAHLWVLTLSHYNSHVLLAMNRSAYKARTDFHCQTFSQGIEEIFSYGRTWKLQCKNPSSTGIWLYFQLSQL